ncbi:hypothetical protein [Maricaulis sp.]|uniref:hypothetical protein n=1 Tax=Maricaulis sp. TaxID=1486257 RepID=UPI003A94006A
MDFRVSDQLIIHRWSDRPDRPMFHMLSADRGVALFDILPSPRSSPSALPRMAPIDFIPNAAIVDSECRPIHWIRDIPRRFRSASYFVQIEAVNGKVALVCFRGEIFELNQSSYSLSRSGFYPKY